MPTTTIDAGQSFSDSVDYATGNGVDVAAQWSIKRLPATPSEGLTGGFKKGERARVISTNLAGTGKKSYVRQFNKNAERRSDIKKPVLKVTINLKPGERLKAYELAEMVDDYRRQMGLTNCPFVAVEHREKPHQHLHVIFSRIDFDGKLARTKFDRLEARRWARRIETKYNLTPTPERTTRRGMTSAENEKRDRDGVLPRHVQLQNHIDAALGNPAHQFVERLEEKNINVMFRFERGKAVGVSFLFAGKKYAGGKLGTDFTWGGLQRRGVGYEPARDDEKLAAASARSARQFSSRSDEQGDTEIQTEQTKIDVQSASDVEQKIESSFEIVSPPADEKLTEDSAPNLVEAQSKNDSESVVSIASQTLDLQPGDVREIDRDSVSESQPKNTSRISENDEVFEPVDEEILGVVRNEFFPLENENPGGEIDNTMSDKIVAEKSGAAGIFTQEIEPPSDTSQRARELQIDRETAARLQDQPLADFWWEVVARGEDDGSVYLNPAGREIVRQSLAQSSLDIENSKPIFDAAIEARTITVMVEKLKEFAEAKPDYAVAIEKVAEAVEKARKSSNGAVFFTSEDTENNVASPTGKLTERDSPVVEPDESHFETTQQSFAKLTKAISEVNTGEQPNRLSEAEKLGQLVHLLKDAADKKLNFTMPSGSEVEVIEETDWERVRLENPKTKPLIYTFVETTVEASSDGLPTVKAVTGNRELTNVVKRIGISAGGDNAPRVVTGKPDGTHGYVPGDLADVLLYAESITKAAEQNARVKTQGRQIEFDNRVRQLKADKLAEMRGKLGIEAPAAQTINDPLPSPSAALLPPPRGSSTDAGIKSFDKEPLPEAAVRSPSQKTDSRISSDLLLQDLQNLPALMAEEIRLHHKVLDAEYKFVEWRKGKDIRRVEISDSEAIGRKGKVSIADLDHTAHTTAKETTTKNDASGGLRLRALEENRPYEELRQEVYRDSYAEVLKRQKPTRARIEKVYSDEAATRGLAIDEKRSSWLKVAGQTEALKSALGEEARQSAQPKFAPEEIWRLQERAGFRGDEAGFLELEAAHRNLQIPRSQAALARLQGIVSISDINVRLERESNAERLAQSKDAETAVIRLSNTGGKIRVIGMHTGQITAGADETQRRAQLLRREQALAENRVSAPAQEACQTLQPGVNRIKPLPPVRETLAGFTYPASPVDDTTTRLDLIKNDPYAQIVRAVAEHLQSADNAFKQKTTAGAAEFETRHYTENIDGFTRAVKNALDSEAQIRADLSVESAAAGENLAIPKQVYRLKDFRKMGDQAIELRDKTLLEEYTERLRDKQLARDSGETESRVLTRSIKAAVETAEEAQNLINSFREIGENELEIEINLSSLPRFIAASRIAESANNASARLSPGTIPSFTPEDEVALRNYTGRIDTRTAVNLDALMERPESAIVSIEKLTEAMTAEAAPQTIPYEQMTPQLQAAYREGLEISKGLMDRANALETQAVLDAQAQMTFRQQAPDAARGIEPLVSPAPPAYTLSHPVTDMKMEERDTLARLAREIESGEIKNAMTMEDIKSLAEFEREEKTEETEEAEETALEEGGLNFSS